MRERKDRHTFCFFFSFFASSSSSYLSHYSCLFSSFCFCNILLVFRRAPEDIVNWFARWLKRGAEERTIIRSFKVLNDAQNFNLKSFWAGKQGSSFFPIFLSNFLFIESVSEYFARCNCPPKTDLRVITEERCLRDHFSCIFRLFKR